MPFLNEYFLGSIHISSPMRIYGILIGCVKIVMPLILRLTAKTNCLQNKVHLEHVVAMLLA